MNKINYFLLPIFFIFGILLFPSHQIFAAAPVSEDVSNHNHDDTAIADEEEFNRLLNILDKHTEIATKSKLNADFVPGMVTVLDGRDLLARGIRDVREALRLVPGIEVIKEGYGDQAASVRGLSTQIASSSTQFMVNGILCNLVYTGSNSAIFKIPMEQVDRIEVVRGPGSAVYGGYANTGVVNIITRTEDNHIYGFGGSLDTYGAGGLFAWRDPERDLRISLNLAGMNADGSDTRSGPDILYTAGQENLSNAPGPINDANTIRSLVLDLTYRDLSFITQYLESGSGDYFGVGNALPPNSDRIVFVTEQWFAKLNQRITFSPSLWVNATLGYMRHTGDINDRLFLYPPGFTTPLYTYPYGMYFSSHYEENRYDGAINLTWQGWQRHKIFAEWSISQTSQGDDTWWESNYDPNTSEPYPSGAMVRFYDNFIGQDHERRINSIAVQDEFSAADNFDITAGLRFDSYNDTDESITPRIAAVWRIAGAHILKAQYAQAFMPPSFLQLYSQFGQTLGNQQLKPQTSENYELGYIYRNTGHVFRLTLFHTILEDLIKLDEANVWTNTGGARVTGAEFEWEQSLSSAIKLDGNISYSNTEDKDTGKAIPGTANFWMNLGLMYEISKDLALNLQYRYVGEQNRDPSDPRDKLDASHTVDVTGNAFNLWTKGLTFRTGIKNIFDEDVRFAAPANTYHEDYPQPGRSWWCEVSYEF